MDNHIIEMDVKKTDHRRLRLVEIIEPSEQSLAIIPKRAYLPCARRFRMQQLHMEREAIRKRLNIITNGVSEADH
jgi:hypothetical protein